MRGADGVPTWYGTALQVLQWVDGTDDGVLNMVCTERFANIQVSVDTRAK